MSQTRTPSPLQSDDPDKAPPSAGDVFESRDDQHLSADALQSALEWLLERFPQAPVAAANETGVMVEMPKSIPLRENPILHGRTGLDLAPEGDRPELIANWDRTLSKGASRCTIHPPDYPDVILYGLDLRELHGIVFGLVALSDSTVDPPPQTTDIARRPPRFATLRKDQLGFVTKIDEALTEILGWSPEEIEGRRSLDFVHPDDHSLAVDNWMQMLALPGPARRVRERMLHKDGSWVWFEITNHNMLDIPDEGCIIAEMVDISDEMATHEALRAREQLLDRLAETVPVGLIQIDAERRIVYTNDRLHEIVGVEPASSLDEQLATVIDADRPVLDAAVRGVLERGAPGDIEAALRLPLCEEMRCCTISLRALSHEDGTISGAIACVVDVTDSARMRAELERRATFDELTGCHNRAAIMRALEAHIASGQRRAERAALFVDMDGFKEVNDRYGHAAGDELLRIVAEQLRAAVRDNDLVGRIGGDEFLVMCPDIGGPQVAMKLAARLMDAMHGDVGLPGGSVHYQVSVGVAWSNGDSTGADTLVAQADRAMYESKRERSGQPKLATAAHEIALHKI